MLNNGSESGHPRLVPDLEGKAYHLMMMNADADVYSEPDNCFFDRVILMDIWDGILPSVDPTEHGRISAEELLEEERRLFYVGVTRAKNHLQVLEYGAKTDDLRAPRFLRELFGLTSPGTAPAGKAVNIPSTFIAGSRVHHRLLGYGTVTACDGKVVAVCFDFPHRERRLDLQVCQKDGLLSLADKK